jgi:lipoprotein-anchoring transpeptidase ErfK/SrfK
MTVRRIAALMAVLAIASPATAAVRHLQPSSKHRRAHHAKAARPIDTNTIELQVRLDRAGFSVGEIDGAMGNNTTRAVTAYVGARKLPENAAIGDISAALGREQNVPGLATYRISAEDIVGPFEEVIPNDMMKQARLESLGFRNALEALGEKLHSSPALLKRLNPKARFVADEEISAPNVATTPPVVPSGDVVIRVSKDDSSLRAETPDGQLVFRAPVTTGSEHDPLPLGDWKVTEVRWHPPFHYNPNLFWDADAEDGKATLPPGPNNPVGVVWIGIDRPHYGLHGTPEPSRIGKAASHGCVRMTNWDAARVASLVRAGTRVLFQP